MLAPRNLPPRSRGGLSGAFCITIVAAVLGAGSLALPVAASAAATTSGQAHNPTADTAPRQLRKKKAPKRSSAPRTTKRHSEHFGHRGSHLGQAESVTGSDSTGSGEGATGGSSTTKPTSPSTPAPITTPISEPIAIPPVTLEPPAAELPTAVPPAATAPSTAGLLFNGTKISDYSVESAPHAVTEVPDPLGSGQTVFDMTVNNADVAPITPTENPRAQALSPAIVKPGGEYWLQTKFLIPTGMPYVSGWMSLVSIYGPPFAGSSPWQITIYEHEIRWMRNFQHQNDIPWRSPVSAAEGKWTTILMHEKFATEGFVEMWVNGQQITFFPPGNRNPNHEAETTHLPMATMDSSNNGGANAAKIMQYRLVNMFQTASVYFGPLKLGTTRAAVES